MVVNEIGSIGLVGYIGYNQQRDRRHKRNENDPPSGTKYPVQHLQPPYTTYQPSLLDAIHSSLYHQKQQQYQQHL
jgi:hypothetical protein